MDDVLVSVRCITYNHAAYLRMALDGFINQRTTFKYEIIVHDDASTDGTTDILREYEKRYPDLIHAFYEEENLYSQGLLRRRMQEIEDSELHGKYIAYCEGDDFWIDYNKLQIQVNYMEQHPDCAMTGHNVLIMDCRDNTFLPMDSFLKEQDVTTKEIILNSKNGFHTSSFVIRKDVLKSHRTLQQDCTVGDWPLRLAASTCGNIHYFDRVMSVYRYYSHGGSWTDRFIKNVSNYIRHHLSMIRYFSRFNEYTNNQYHELLNNQIEASLLAIIRSGRQLDIEEFQSLCDIAVKENAQNAPYINSLITMKKESVNVDEEMVRFINKYEKIYIMGTGRYAELLVEQLENLPVTYDGFVVSNDQPIKGMFAGKSVYHLKDIAADADNTGILIAIKKNLKDVIEASLESNHIYNYFWPLL